MLDAEDIYPDGVDPVVVRRTIGMVFQRPNPFPTMSVRDNVLAGVRLRSKHKAKNLDEVAKWSLCLANLWDEVKDRLDKPGGSLSGGQQQRLCIARAIAVQPQVLLTNPKLQRRRAWTGSRPTPAGSTPTRTGPGRLFDRPYP